MRTNEVITLWKQRASTLAIVALASYATAAGAIDLSWQPQIRWDSRATDNVLSTNSGQEAAWGIDNGGAVILKAASTDWRSTVTPDFNFRRFAIGKNLDADEYGVHSQHQWDATGSLQFGLEADYVRDSTLTTELVDAGRQTVVADRDTTTVGPSLAYRFDDTTTLNANFLYSDVGFSGTTDQSLVGYEYKQIGVGATHVLNDRLQINANAFVSEFDTPAVGGKTITYGGQGGVTYQFREDLAFDLGWGYLKSNIDFQNSFLTLVFDPLPRIVQINQPGHASTDGPIANVSIRKTFEEMRARLDYARSVSPSIRGSQTLEDNFVVSLDRDLSKRWIVGLRGTYNMRTAQAQDAGANIVDLNRDQAVVGGYVSYQLTRRIILRADYRYARTDLTSNNEIIESNALFINVTYNGDAHNFEGY